MLINTCTLNLSHDMKARVLYDILVSVKAARHECVIRTGLP